MKRGSSHQLTAPAIIINPLPPFATMFNDHDLIVSLTGVTPFPSKHPVYVALGVALFIAWLIWKSKAAGKKDRVRGWRVGHSGRDMMYYEELRAGKWERIEVGGEMLTGKAHHVIYFSSIVFPEWAKERRSEIIDRIKSEFTPPGYEYQD